MIAAFTLFALTSQAVEPPIHHTETQDPCSVKVESDAAILTAPFKIVDGRIYLEAFVNERGPFIFAVDTGAGGMGRADTSLAKELMLPEVASALASDGLSSANVPVSKISKLRIGSYETIDLELITRDYNSRMSPEQAISGILGRAFFENGTLVIDYPNRVVTYTNAVSLQPGSPNVLHYDRAFRVPVTVAGQTFEANLDTGANAEFVMPTDLYRSLSENELNPAENATFTNNDVETVRGILPGPVRLGGAEIADADVRASDRFNEWMIGARILQYYRLLIDQRSNSVAVCPADDSTDPSRP